MKIQIKPSTGDPFIVTPGGGRTAPTIKDFHVAEIRDEQLAKGLRWPEAEAINRDNEVSQITFTCEIEHENEAAAEAYLLLSKVARPKEGDVFFESEGGAGIVTVMEKANIIVPDSHYAGCVTFHQYLMRGGKMRKV